VAVRGRRKVAANSTVQSVAETVDVRRMIPLSVAVISNNDKARLVIVGMGVRTPSVEQINAASAELRSERRTDVRSSRLERLAQTEVPL
jgi:hypothetical protein